VLIERDLLGTVVRVDPVEGFATIQLEDREPAPSPSASPSTGPSVRQAILRRVGRDPLPEGGDVGLFDVRGEADGSLTVARVVAWVDGLKPAEDTQVDNVVVRCGGVRDLRRTGSGSAAPGTTLTAD